MQTSQLDTTHPDYWHLLSDLNQKEYRALQHRIDPLSFRTTRAQTPLKLHIIITQIHHFAIRHDSDDWKRCLVCGMVWLGDALAVSTRQMSFLVGRSKSSINSGFQALGYSSGNMSESHTLSLMKVFPFLVQNYSEIRQWTIRENCGGEKERERKRQNESEEVEKRLDPTVSFLDLDEAVLSSREDDEESFEFAISFD
jgi:hypothetical protein